MPRYRIADDALLEIQAILDNIQAENHQAAQNWLRELQRKFTTLAGMPRMGRVRDDLIPDLYAFPYGNHMIFYDQGDAGIVILHVIDARQDIPNLPLSTRRTRPHD